MTTCSSTHRITSTIIAKCRNEAGHAGQCFWSEDFAAASWRDQPALPYRASTTLRQEISLAGRTPVPFDELPNLSALIDAYSGPASQDVASIMAGLLFGEPTI